MIPQWESAPAVCRPGLCRNNPGSSTPAPFQAVREIPGLRPPADYNPGRSGETSPTQQKSHGAFMLHGFDWFGDLWGGDAGGCGQLLLGLPGLERIPALPTFPGCAENPGPYPPAGHFRGVPVKSPPPNKKAMGLSCSMALIDFRIYSMAMRVDAGSSC